MKVLVTGSAGYIGSHLLLLIEQLRPDWKVFGLDRVPGQTFCCDLASDPIPDEWFDVVVHLAGHAFVEKPGCSAVERGPIWCDNVSATQNILDRAQTNKIVLASSCAVYGDSTELLTETLETGPVSAYGLSKVMCENHLLRWQHDVIEKQQKRHVHIMRLFNVAGWFGGKHEAACRIVPGSVLSALFGDEMTIAVDEYENTLIRDFVHVVDVCGAIIKAVEHHCCGLYNIGSGQGYHLHEPLSLACTMARKFGVDATARWTTKLKKTNEPLCSVADTRKAKRILDWSPTKDLRSIVASTIESIKVQECQTSPVK